MRNPDVAVKYALEQKRILFTLQQYASASVRILLQRLGLPVVSTQLAQDPTQEAQDVAALFILYSAGVRILLQRFGLPVVPTQEQNVKANPLTFHRQKVRANPLTFYRQKVKANTFNILWATSKG